jgi:hypothetical protein
MLVVNFDDLFTLAYLSHMLWSWALGRVWCRHISLSSNLYLKGCPFCPTFSLEKEPWRQPYQVFALQLDHAPQLFTLGFLWGWGYMKESLGFLQGKCFHANFWNFQVILTIKINLILVQNKLVLKNSSDSYWQVSWNDENFLCLLLG